MKVFSFSLFGDNPIYTIGTIKNVKLINKYFPEWGIFIYTNKNEFDNIIQKLLTMGCIIRYEKNDQWVNSTWRFKSITESDVDVMVCRDSDSRISERDVSAINEWLSSDYNYNIIRDHPIGHHWKMNAGMWGAKKTDFIVRMNEMINDFKKTNSNLINQKTFDQIFLANVIYPHIVKDTIIHDEYYGYENHAKPINHDRESNDFRFIGESIDENDEPRGNQVKEIMEIYKNRKKMDKKNFRIVTTTNENDTYLPFWPTMAQHWKNFGGFDNITLGFVTEREEDDLLVSEMRQYGEVILIKPIKGIDIGIQSKVSRMYLSSQKTDEYCIIADIDMYILNKNFLWDNWFSKVEENKLLAVGGNSGCYVGDQKGKFPMAFTTAKGDVWSEIINPNNLNYEDLLNSWYTLKVCDMYESTGNEFGKFSDESLLRGLIGLWGNYGGTLSYDHPKVKHIKRDDWAGCHAMRRIDRINWSVNTNKLNEGFFIDCQPVRPFNGETLKPILNYLGIDENKWYLKND